ncbi:MAG: winged helix-turn-helix domain-containing protein [Pyrinomonadaceae bacterium]
MKIYRFRNILLNTVERSIWNKGELVFLPAKCFDILRLLIEHGGRTVSKDLLLGEIWEGAVVEEGNLAVHVCKLRKILACGRSDRIIETVHGCGYRLACKMEEIDEHSWIERTRWTANATREPSYKLTSDPIFRKIKIRDDYIRLRIEIENEFTEVGEHMTKRERERERESLKSKRKSGQPIIPSGIVRLQPIPFFHISRYDIARAYSHCKTRQYR